MMDCQKLFHRIVCWTIIVFILVGCAAAPSPLPSPNPPLVSPAVASPTPAAPLTAPTLIAARGDKEWDYVVLGDSTQEGFAPWFAQILEQDLGVKINLQLWTSPGQHSRAMLDALRSDQSLRQAIGAAQVVTFYIPVAVFQQPSLTLIYGNAADCGGADHQDCWREALKIYEADCDAIFAELVSLRSPSEALIRTMDIYQFNVKDTRAAGVFEITNAYWKAASEYATQAAARYHIPAAAVYAAFMGPNGDEDPVDKGLVGDGVHANVDGQQLIAGLLRNLGYAYATAKP